MTMHRVIWQAKETCTFTVAREGEPYEVSAYPIVTEFYFGVTVGFFYRKSDSFGHWYSSSTCSPLTAWRVAQLLPKVKTLREVGGGYDQTLCGLVIAMGSDRHDARMFNRAKDLDMTVEELESLLDRINQQWPSVAEISRMWDRLSSNAQENFSVTLRSAIDEGTLPPDQEILSRVGVAELRRRSAAEQKVYEDGLIEAGLQPEVSLRQFLQDIGVSNLLYSVGCGDWGEPSHFAFDKLDEEFMRELIGTRGYGGRIPLYTADKQPDDPTAHQVSGGGGVTIYASDFGEPRHPRAQFNGKQFDLTMVRWDPVTERFLVTIRPIGLKEHDDSRDEEVSIEFMRIAIGKSTELGHALPPGQKPKWLNDTKRKRSWSWLTGNDS